MIRITRDVYHLYSAQAGRKALIVTDSEQYVWVRREIYQTLNATSPRNLDIVVRDERVWYWLQDLRDYEDYVPSKLIQFNDLSPRSQFTERFRFPPPLGFADSTLHYLLGSSLSVPGSLEREDPEGWVLGELLNPLWRVREPNEHDLVQFVLWLQQDPQVPPDLLPLVEKRLVTYQEKNDRYKGFRVSTWYATAQRMLQRVALRGYPSDFLEKFELSRVPLIAGTVSTDILQAAVNADKKLQQAIRSFWKTGLRVADLGGLQAALSEVGGLLVEEAQGIVDLLQRQPTLLNPSLIKQIQSRFSSSNAASIILSALTESVSVSAPTIPQPNWDEVHWQQWATEQYLPYFEWVIRTDQPRETQLELGEAFARWYIDKYRDLWNDDRLLNRQRRTIIEQRKEVTLWLIVDSLTWWEAQTLVKMMGAKGLGVTELPPSFAVLPSITSVSKRALIEGRFPYPPSTASLRQRASETLTPHVGEKVHVFTQSGEFEKIINHGDLDVGFYLLFYNDLDSHHHDTSTMKVTVIEGILKDLTELSSKFFQSARMLGLGSTIFVSSDHGVTLLPKNNAPLQLPQVEVVEEDSEESNISQTKSRARTRVGTVSTTPKNHQKQWGDKWGVLRKDLLRLPHNYVIPITYNSIGGTISTWTHGGASPEEVVVPFLQLQPTPVQHLEPVLVEISMTGGTVPVQDAFVLEVRLKNINPYPLVGVDFILEGYDTHSVGRLEPNVEIDFTVDIPSEIRSSSDWTYVWQVTYRVDGRAKIDTGTQSLSFGGGSYYEPYDPFNM